LSLIIAFLILSSSVFLKGRKVIEKIV
jgi:hypothetical protein